MTTSSTLRALGWLIRDTFRQSLATRLFWLMLTVSAVGVLLCLSVSVPDVAPMGDPAGDPLGALYVGDKELSQAIAEGGHAPARMSLGFGLFQVDYFRDGPSQIHFLMVVLAVGLAGTLGTLLTVIFTGGFLPESLQPSAASVLLAKPIPRRLLLLGKYLGVVSFVAFHAGIFVLGTWTALGIRTGSWMPGYLWSFPLLLGHFAVIYGFSALLAVLTRNAIACVFGTILFWAVCFGMNSGRHASVALPELARTAAPESSTAGASAAPKAGEPAPAREIAEQSPALGGMLGLGYWLLPKPADFGILLDEAVSGSQHMAAPESFQAVVRMGRFYPVLSVLSSLAFAAAMLAMASREFDRMDY
jgi:ABC-type transport system involved in multi-copper enzyme maturation permease subunit